MGDKIRKQAMGIEVFIPRKQAILIEVSILIAVSFFFGFITKDNSFAIFDILFYLMSLSFPLFDLIKKIR